MLSWLKSSASVYLLATAFEVAAGLRNLILSQRDFKKAKLDTSLASEILSRAKSERLVAILWFTASLLTMYGLYLDFGYKAEDAARFEAVTNELAQTKAQVTAQSNALVAAKIKSPKERLIDCLNSIDPRIISKLRVGQYDFPFTLLPYQVDNLRNLADEPALSAYISLEIQNPGMMILSSHQGQVIRGVLHLKPSLLK